MGRPANRGLGKFCRVRGSADSPVWTLQKPSQPAISKKVNKTHDTSHLQLCCRHATQPNELPDAVHELNQNFGFFTAPRLPSNPAAHAGSNFEIRLVADSRPAFSATPTTSRDSSCPRCRHGTLLDKPRGKSTMAGETRPILSQFISISSDYLHFVLCVLGAGAKGKHSPMQTCPFICAGIWASN